MEYETTYRLVMLDEGETCGRTAATPELAKLAPGDLTQYRTISRLGLERTDWTEEYGKPKIRRTILIDAESKAGEWVLGA